MKTILQSRWFQLAVLVVLVLGSRWFFLSDGYGVEEDSWGLVVNAYEMHDSGHYIASRVPGHPVEEYAYLFFHDASPFVYNFFSAVFAAAAICFFFLSLRKICPACAWPGALAFAFVPVFYIAGTYTADYTWTLAFVMLAFWLLLENKLVACGLMIGMAIGCRITAGAFLLPFLLLVWDRRSFAISFRKALLIGIPATMVGILWFIPSYMNHGASFFDYSDQFPYPPLAKIIYKASIGVFGLVGMIAVTLGFIAGIYLWKKRRIRETTTVRVDRLLWVCLLIIVLHIFSYLRLPQKSAYMIPIIPFVILFLAVTLSRRSFNIVCGAMAVSSFCCSINLTDPLRGSESTASSVTFHIAGQEIFFDPLSGPVFSERSKRLRKLEYCRKVIEQVNSTMQKTAIIAGWWYNELVAERYHQPLKTTNVEYKFYCTCAEMEELISRGYVVTFLPEQDLYNDQMFGQQCTGQLAKPFTLK
ncbi:MAG: hypothetical protein FD123_4298 [Bacteroidetes bacterium]|nr:MAG: hypothetical protein FD123_4298 [Bacteroidota bacterium]